MGRDRKWTDEALVILVREFESGMKVRDMATLHNVSRIRMYQLLRLAGVQIKTRKNDSGIPESVQT